MNLRKIFKPSDIRNIVLKKLLKTELNGKSLFDKFTFAVMTEKEIVANTFKIDKAFDFYISDDNRLVVLLDHNSNVELKRIDRKDIDKEVMSEKGYNTEDDVIVIKEKKMKKKSKKPKSKRKSKIVKRIS